MLKIYRFGGNAILVRGERVVSAAQTPEAALSNAGFTGTNNVREYVPESHTRISRAKGGGTKTIPAHWRGAVVQS